MQCQKSDLVQRLSSMRYVHREVDGDPQWQRDRLQWRSEFSGIVPITGISVAVLDQPQVSYTVAGGTLIGVMRDHGMNPNEIDNDVHILEPNFRFTREMLRDLYDRKLVMLWDDCWRICRRLDADQPRRRGLVTKPLYYFWGYFPYSDIGNIGAEKASYGIEGEGAGVLWENSGSELVKRKIGDIWVSTPNDEVTTLWLNELYGDWKTPVSKVGDFLSHLF